jgi:hypothetical protein
MSQCKSSISSMPRCLQLDRPMFTGCHLLTFLRVSVSQLTLARSLSSPRHRISFLSAWLTTLTSLIPNQNRPRIRTLKRSRLHFISWRTQVHKPPRSTSLRPHSLATSRTPLCRVRKSNGRELMMVRSPRQCCQWTGTKIRSPLRLRESAYSRYSTHPSPANLLS